MSLPIDVIIIGAGWSGLLACKHVLENGLEPLVLEARETIGGVWRYDDSPDVTTVMRSTRTTSSRGITEISDFPMPDDYPAFPSHGQIAAYLDAYADRFGLGEHIRLGTRVERADRVAGGWEVRTGDGEVHRSRLLVVCSGLHCEPDLTAARTVFGDFTGTVAHSASFKHPEDSHRDSRILVFGGGETASDVAYDLSKVAAEVHLAIANGAWFVHRRFSHRESADNLDAWSSALRAVASPTDQGAWFPLFLLNTLFGFQGHGRPEWRSPSPYYGQFFNKSDDVLLAVAEGTVKPRPRVVGCSGKTVEFADGTSAEVDQVVLCTGYRRKLAFMPDRDTAVYRHYLFVFDNDDPTLAMLGFVRPVVTSIPFIAEQQARLVARVFSGRIRLPDRAARDREIAADAAVVGQRFARSSRRLDGLVDPQWYSGRVARATGTFPRFAELARRHPLAWAELVRLPAHGGIWLVNDALGDRERLQRIRRTMRRYRARPDQLRFYLDQCWGWLLVWPCEAAYRLWLRMTGRAPETGVAR